MSDATRPRNRRRFRSHMTNHEVRLRLVLDDAVFALVAALAAIVILYVLSNREIGDTLWQAHLSIKETRELLQHGAVIAGIVTFVAVLLFGFWSLIDAHRIAGPMHRLQRLLTEIGDGNLGHEIRFRKRDEFHDIAAATDRLVDTYVERLGPIVAGARELEASLATQAPGSPALQQAHDLVERLTFFRLPANGTPVVEDAGR